MSNQFVFSGTISQGTSLTGEVANQLVILGGVKQDVGPVYDPDLSAPIFAGIDLVVPGVDGDIFVSWIAATGLAEQPIRYRVYVAEDSVNAATLFVSSNVAAVVESLTEVRLFTLGDGVTVFLEDKEYTFGVRAVSAVDVSDTNTELIVETSISTGNPVEILQNLVNKLEKSAAILTGLGGTGVEFQSYETSVTIEMDGVP
jgi:hypothetical protein